MAVTHPYETLTHLKAVLKLDQSDTTLDEKLTGILSVVSDAIDHKCNRTFQAFDTATPRKYVASYSPILYIHDALEITSVVLSLNNYTLTTAEYEPHPLNLVGNDTCYEWITRLSILNYTELPWGAAPGLQPVELLFYPGLRPIVTVTAKWGYAPTCPEVIRQACRQWSMRMYQAEMANYGNEKGLGAGGFAVTRSPAEYCDANIEYLLAPFVRQFLPISS